MKHILLLLSLTLMAVQTSFAAPQRGTADYYLEAPDRYLGNTVSLYLRRATMYETIEAPEKYTTFIAFTSPNNGQGREAGYIKLYVRTIRAEKFAEKYAVGWYINGRAQVKQISGKFMKAVDGDGYAIMMN